jgi:hypothetical protein
MLPEVISRLYSPKVGITADPRNPAMVQAEAAKTRARRDSNRRRGSGGLGFSLESAAQKPRQAVPQALKARAAKRSLGGKPSMAAMAVPTAASAPAQVVRLMFTREV